MITLRKLFLTGMLGTALLVAGCGESTEQKATEADSVTIADQWVKAAASGMTGAFAQLSNSSDTDVRLVSVSSPSSKYMEIHEMAMGADGANVMRKKEDGLIIPAKASSVLAPGEDHLMLLDLVAPLNAGATTNFTLTFADGSTKSFEAQARDFSGNKENYQPAEGSSTTPNMTGHSG